MTTEPLIGTLLYAQEPIERAKAEAVSLDVALLRFAREYHQDGLTAARLCQAPHEMIPGWSEACKAYDLACFIQPRDWWWDEKSGKLGSKIQAALDLNRPEAVDVAGWIVAENPKLYKEFAEYGGVLPGCIGVDASGHWAEWQKPLPWSAWTMCYPGRPDAGTDPHTYMVNYYEAVKPELLADLGIDWYAIIQAKHGNGWTYLDSALIREHVEYVLARGCKGVFAYADTREREGTTGAYVGRYLALLGKIARELREPVTKLDLLRKDGAK